MPSRRKQTYAECVAEGRCPCCHSMLGPEEKFKLCEKCRFLHKKRLLARMARGLCRRCSQKATHGSLCATHVKDDRTRSANRSKKLRDAKLCQRCRVPAKKALCDACAKEKSERTKKKRVKLRAAGLCVECGAEALPEMSLCPGCREDVRQQDVKRQADPVRREEQRKRAAARKLKYAAAGLCNCCGKAPPTPGRKRCEPCAKRSRIANQIRALKERTKRLSLQNKPNPAISTLEPGELRKLMKV